jgi:hypothetical protein
MATGETFLRVCMKAIAQFSVGASEGFNIIAGNIFSSLASVKNSKVHFDKSHPLVQLKPVSGRQV